MDLTNADFGPFSPPARTDVAAPTCYSLPSGKGNTECSGITDTAGHNTIAHTCPNGQVWSQLEDEDSLVPKGMWYKRKSGFLESHWCVPNKRCL